MYIASLTPTLRGAAPREPSQSAGASAIEVAVVPATAPTPSVKPAAPAPAPAPVMAAAVAEPAAPVPDTPAAPAPVAVAALEPRSAPLVVEPAGRGEAHPPAEFVPATDRNAPKTTAARTGRAPSRTVETMVAEAMLPPNTVGKGERVVIRFVSQRSGGCGSLEGRDRVCVALAGGTGAGM